LRPPDDVADPEVLDQAIEVIRSRVDALGVAEPDITRQGNAIVVELPGVSDQQRAIEVVGQTAELRFRPVLEILPPFGTPTPATTTTAPAVDDGATTSTTEVEGATTTTAPGDDVTSTTVEGAAATEGEAPETTTVEGAAATEGEDSETTGPPDGSDTTETTAAADGSTTTTVPPGTTVPSQEPGEVPTTEPEDNVADAEVVLPQLDEEGNVVQRYRLGPTQVTGKAVDSAQARLQGAVQWTVELSFTSPGIEEFNALAATCAPASATCPPGGINQQTGQPVGSVAIELDGVVQSAPTIQEASFTRDQVVISGSFTEDQAKDLALVLRFGALPVQLEQASASTVSATLGRDSLRAGVIAGALGTLLVLGYIVLYYRSLGVVVLAGLCVWAALQWSVISYLGASRGLALSLSGVTGLIVSVGITVDSYIVYFERLKDEIRRGRSVRSAVDRGFSQAFRTILTADATAFMGAALLYILTVGPVRGFALFLGLSTVLDVIVAYFFTRPLVAILAKRGFFSGGFLGLRAAPPDRRGRQPVPVGGGS
ncbi:MAG: protein translocase subunit SecD, partial [Actinomycetota bacterium]|nr:protein translocase subunit SecD [Actinomycetota bacterium]